MYLDPTGELAPLAIGAAIAGGAWAATELALSLYDLYSLYDLWRDPCATGLDRGLETAATAAGLFLPGAGQTGLARSLSQNPFIGRTAQEIADRFIERGFTPRGPNPAQGYGDFLNPRTGTSYHLDVRHDPPKPRHVSVHRTEGPRNSPVRRPVFEFPLE